MWKIHMTESYVRIRVRRPGQFIPGSFRTHDIGRVGHTKRIAGRLKRNRKWATQAILIKREDYPRSKKTRWFHYAKSRYKRKR